MHKSGKNTKDNALIGQYFCSLPLSLNLPINPIRKMVRNIIQGGYHTPPLYFLLDNNMLGTITHETTFPHLYEDLKDNFEPFAPLSSFLPK